MKNKSKFVLLSLLSVSASLVACNKTANTPISANSEQKSSVNASTSTALPGVAVVESIYIKTAPAKVNYYVGETFDPTGMSVKAKWSDSIVTSVDLKECTFLPNGPLTKNDTKVTVTYQGKSVDQPISIIDEDVASLSIDTGNIALKAAVNTTLNFTGIKVTAKYADGNERDVTSASSFVIDGKAVADISNLTYASTGTHTFTAKYSNQESSFTFRIFDGFLIEAENILSEDQVTDESKNYVSIAKSGDNGVSPSPVSKEEEPASGGAYLGRIFNGAVLDFHIFVEKDSTADLILRAASSYLISDYEGTWVPIEMGDEQFNKLFEVQYAAKSDLDSGKEMTNLVINDDIILRGSKTDNEYGDSSLWVKWMDVSFGSVNLKSGDNIVRLKVNSSYVNMYDEACSCNIDRMEIQYSNN